MRILLLPGSYHSPSARFRIWQFVEPLRRRGHEVETRVINPTRTWESRQKSPTLRRLHGRLGSLARIASALWITRDIERYDVVIMNRDLLPEVRVDGLEPWLAKRNRRLIFDFDDAIFVGARDGKLRKILPHFAWITAGNAYLAEYARQHNANVSILPTVVDTDKYKPAAARQPGPLRVGWSGSSSTLRYSLPLIKEVITRLSQEEDFEFVVIAEVPPKINWPGVRMRYIPWTAQSEVEGLQQIDIGLMPLRDEAFERGKCGLKAIQYMGVGIPALVSPVGANQEIVVHGKTGYHCVSEDDWIENILTLIHTEDIRVKMGRDAIKHVENFYSIKNIITRMEKIFWKIMG